MQNEKYLSREKTQALIDGLNVKASEGKAFLQGLADKGYTIQGFNDQPKPAEPTMMESIKTKLSDIGNKQTETIQKSAELYKTGKQGILPTIGQTLGASVKAAGESFALPINEAVNKATSFVGEYAPENIKQAAIELAQKGIELSKPTLEAYNALPEAERANIKAIGDLISGVTNLAIGGGAVKGIGGAALKTAETLPKVSETITTTAKSATDNLLTKVIPKPITPTRALGQIAQGTTEDIKPVAKVLSIIDTTKVKTFDDLLNKVDSTIPTLAKKVDDELLKDTGTYSLSDLALSQKTGSGKEIKTDYISRALNNLSELYKTTGDDVAKADVDEIIAKATTQGLTRKEVNDISRIYGQEFGKKAFNKIGDPLTSVNAQAFENVRSGLKQVARQGIGGTEAKAIDEQLSALFDTQRLVEKNVEAVNKLKQKIQDRGLLENLTHNAFKALDMLSAGSIRGIIGGLLPRGAGYKTMNALDIEDALRGNLNIVEKALKTNSDEELMKLLNNSYSKELKSRSASSLIKPSTPMTRNTTKSVTNMSDTIPQSTKGASGKMSGFAQVTKDIPKELQPLAEEARKYKSAEEFVKAQGTPLYHGGAGVDELSKMVKILTPEEKLKYPSSGGGYIGLSTSPDKSYAMQFSQNIGNTNKVAEMYLSPTAKIKELKTGMIDDMSAEELANISKKYDAIKSVEDNEVRVLNSQAVKTKQQLIDLWNKANGKK